MGYADRYIHSLAASNLMDDENHCQAEPLMAAGFAASHLGGPGSLLMRVKYMDATARKDFEGNPENLRQLRKLWIAEVTKRGTARMWVAINSERDEKTAHYLYVLVAHESLSYWLDGKCKECGGTGLHEHRACKPCDGSGEAPIKHKGAFIADRIKDMVSELREMETGFAGVANRWMQNVRL